MELRDFAREIVKAADGRSLASKALRWFTTSPVKAGRTAAEHAEGAKRVISEAGKRLSKDERMNLNYIAANRGPFHAHGGSKKYVGEQLKKHDVRRASLKKPLLAGGAALGTLAAAKGSRQERRPVALPDRSPQLVQDPSKVVY